MTATVKLAGGNSPEGRLAALKAGRAGLQARIAELTTARQRLDAATETERAATAAMGELDAVEIAVASEWASMGASGAPPAPDLTRRAKLTATLSAAQAAAATARGAGANLDAEMAGFRAEAAAIEAEIEAVALDVLETERQATLAELIKIAAHAGLLIAKLRAHHLSIGERARALRDSGEQRRAQPLFVESEKLAAIPLPDPQPSVSDLDAARRRWVQRFESLRG